MKVTVPVCPGFLVVCEMRMSVIVFGIYKIQPFMCSLREREKKISFVKRLKEKTSPATQLLYSCDRTVYWFTT